MYNGAKGALMGKMNNNCSSCQSTHSDICLHDAALGMGYIPWQTWGDIYDLNRGLHAGTIFPCLDKPFTGRWPLK